VVRRGKAWPGQVGCGWGAAWQGEVFSERRSKVSHESGCATAIGPEVTNGAEATVVMERPYVATVTIRGTADLLMHRWNCEAADAKSKAAKGSKAKKSDDTESYVYRDEDGYLAVPGEYLRQAIIAAAKFRQDPRSPRKSAVDLFKAGLVCLTPLATLGPKPLKRWDYEDRRRVVVQRNAITRVRPAVRQGWELTVELMVLLPEYVAPELLLDVINAAGRLIGLADFRPTYGRFAVARCETNEAD